VPFNQALAAEGAAVFPRPANPALRGIVSKREGSFYRSGKSRNRLKTKNPDFVRT
jgi:ATP-dependent DNA ligase